jgi:hypothetical protein
MNHREILQALLDGETIVDTSNLSVTLVNTKLVYNKGLSTERIVCNLSFVHLFQIKPKTININGFEVPCPIRKLNDKQVYYWINVALGIVNTTYFASYDEDNARLVNGVVHLTKEAAELHLKALLSFTKLENKDDN